MNRANKDGFFIVGVSLMIIAVLYLILAYTLGWIK